MAKLRLLFVKEDRAAYISHLDLLRTFQRAFLRLGLVLRHSQGFHPHPILSFALPLPVGQCSDCELLDFETVEDLDAAALPAEETCRLELANAIAANAQVAVRQSKAAIRRGLQTDMATGTAFEAEAFGLCFATEDQKDAMKAFVNKEKVAAFKNR